MFVIIENRSRIENIAYRSVVAGRGDLSRKLC